MIAIGYSFDCPFCGFVNVSILEAEAKKSILVQECDTEEGGCGRRVVLDLSLGVIVKTYKILEG